LSTLINEEETLMYKIISANFLDSWHYHGSWFEYKYNLRLLKDGIEEQKVLWSYDYYRDFDGETLEGRNIEIQKDGMFRVV
jgi:hypothetical protein